MAFNTDNTLTLLTLIVAIPTAILICYKFWTHCNASRKQSVLPTNNAYDLMNNRAGTIKVQAQERATTTSMNNTILFGTEATAPPSGVLPHPQYNVRVVTPAMPPPALVAPRPNRPDRAPLHTIINNPVVTAA